MLRRFALLGVMACLLPLLAGCLAVQPKPDGTYSVSVLPPSAETTTGGGSSSSSSGGSASSTKSAANSIGKGTNGSPAYPGTILKSGPWAAGVESTKFVQSLEDGSKAASGKRFLVVNVAIRNAGAGNALTVAPNEFALWSGANKVVDPYPTKLGIYNAQSMRPLDAGLGGYTTFVYEVPADTAVYTFTLTPMPKAGTSGPMSWRVP